MSRHQAAILNFYGFRAFTRQQVKQAEEQKTAADGAVRARLPETYQWLLVPTQVSPQAVEILGCLFVTKPLLSMCSLRILTTSAIPLGC